MPPLQHLEGEEGEGEEVTRQHSPQGGRGGGGGLKGGREGGRKGRREGGREGRREGERVGGREGEREGGREGRRERERVGCWETRRKGRWSEIDVCGNQKCIIHTISSCVCLVISTPVRETQNPPHSEWSVYSTRP